MLNRGSEYTLHAVKGEYGYNFRENQYKEHNFNPISISYVSTTFPSDTTEQRIYAQNPLLRTTLEKQFIIGSSYNFTYTNQMETKRRNNIYFYGGLETGGNVWGLFTPTNDKGQKLS